MTGKIFDSSVVAFMIQVKKSLGQHFLHDENIARKIATTFLDQNHSDVILEVGPGTGALTKYLLEEKSANYFAVEADERMINHLRKEFPQLKSNLIHGDFLDFDFSKINADSISMIGNFPYNISSQILFRVFENKGRIPLMIGMFQKEVALRIAAKHGNKEYGILSVLLQAFYEVKYLFEVHERSFSPPPKVKSAVIQLSRKKIAPQLKNESLFRALVKAGFNQRRKTLRNSLSKLIREETSVNATILSKRAEQLSVEEWIDLSNRIFEKKI